MFMEVFVIVFIFACCAGLLLIVSKPEDLTRKKETVKKMSCCYETNEMRKKQLYAQKIDFSLWKFSIVGERNEFDSNDCCHPHWYWTFGFSYMLELNDRVVFVRDAATNRGEAFFSAMAVKDLDTIEARDLTDFGIRWGEEFLHVKGKTRKLPLSEIVGNMSDMAQKEIVPYLIGAIR